MSQLTPRSRPLQVERFLPDMNRRQALSALALLCAGCAELDLQLPSPEEKARKKRQKNARDALRGEKGHSQLLGDYLSVRGLTATVVEGIGMVSNLNGTGGDPPASSYRTELLEDMKRREIKDPNQIIADSSTALVLVRAYLPPLINRHDKIDVEVLLPPGSEATSLQGGVLMECELTEKAYAQGRGVLKGHRMAVAHGPVIAIPDGKRGKESRSGRIPGGATYAGLDQNLSLLLRPDYHSVRMTQTIAQRIGRRFHDYNESGQRVPLAKPKTDSRIELILHSRYRDNYPRFLQCISHIRLRETPVERRLRLERLREDLLTGPTAEMAALQLEGVGRDAIPVLLEGLDSEDLEVRFHSAQALAYLGESEAASALGEAADKEPAFRVFALAALAALGGIDAVSELRELLNHESLETRYGAVRALSTIDEDDPSIRGEEADRGFTLRVVNSTGKPMIHMTQRRKAEFVVFGADQEFQPPMIVSAGRHFIIKGEPGKPLVTISRFVEGRDVLRTTVPARVADVIHELGQLQASYPDVVQMLLEAERQHNLPGELGIDELPRPGRIYTRSSGDDGAVGNEGSAPNLFGIDLDPDELDVDAFDDDDAPPDESLQADASSPTSDTQIVDPTNPVGFTVQ